MTTTHELPEGYRLYTAEQFHEQTGRTIDPGFYFEPTDYEGDVPFAGPYKHRADAIAAAWNWVNDEPVDWCG